MRLFQCERKGFVKYLGFFIQVGLGIFLEVFGFVDCFFIFFSNGFQLSVVSFFICVDFVFQGERVGVGWSVFQEVFVKDIRGYLFNRNLLYIQDVLEIVCFRFWGYRREESIKVFVFLGFILVRRRRRQQINKIQSRVVMVQCLKIKKESREGGRCLGWGLEEVLFRR